MQINNKMKLVTIFLQKFQLGTNETDNKDLNQIIKLLNQLIPGITEPYLHKRKAAKLIRAAG